MNTLPIHERFTTFQGEGVHSGRKAHFIRTLGCPLHCPWCDSAGTWHPEWMPKKRERVSITELVREAYESGASFVVITGGEPCVHAETVTLAKALRARGMKVHLETCGAFLVDVSAFDWITLSPKESKRPLEEMVLAAHEFKIIVDAPMAIEKWLAFLVGQLRGRNPLRPVWLHPEWSLRNDPAILNYITQTVTTGGDPLRAGYQTHKLYQADKLDERAVAPAPLGGNEALGM